MTSRPPTLLFLICSSVLWCFSLHAQTRIDPKHPDWQWFPAVDTMYGISEGVGRGAQFGREIHSIGDIDNSGTMDFVINHLRTDTLFDGRAALELLLYRGIKGKYPEGSGGERIGLSEIGARVQFLAAGDFDGDNHRDIVVKARILGDTSLGNINAEYDLYTQIVFWNDGTGHFSLNDTTHLTIEGVDRWLAIQAVVHDWGNDGADDLLVWNSATGYRHGQQFASIASFHLFTGQQGQRWGRHEVPRTPSWQWWTPIALSTVGDPIDHDGDGVMDIPLLLNLGGAPGIAQVSVLYGRSGELPDTTNIETITMEEAGGRNAHFSDITGDGLPELLVDAGSQEVTKIYAGSRAQRLLEQYGSGNDEPIPEKGWWRRPWAEIWSAGKLNDGWNGSGFNAPFAYDGNLDGINDLWLISSPYLVCYVSGNQLDSLIDGIIDVSQGGTIGYIGDILGSGANIIAVQSTSLNAVILYAATSKIPETGVFRKLPHLPPTSTVNLPIEQSTDVEHIQLQANPNPATGVVRVNWKSSSNVNTATIIVRDMLGREVAHWNVAADQQHIDWATKGIVGGTYFITLNINDHTTTVQLTIR